METYKNDYSKEEDEILWEIHEIRNQLHKKINKKNYDAFNDEARKILINHKSRITASDLH